MKMKRNSIFRLLTVALMIVAMAAGVSAKGKKRAAEGVENEALTTILRGYVGWNNVEFSGKLRQEKLPLSPTVKMYMEKGSLIEISARAPLVGEVARLQLTQDSLLIVNKMKKTYCQESTEKLRKFYPDFLDDLQSFLLARIVVFGHGELSAENASLVDLLPGETEGWSVTPVNDKDDDVDVTYLYTTAGNGRTESMKIESLRHKFGFEMLYDYSNGGVDINFALKDKKKTISGELDFTSVKWGGKRMTPIRLAQRYTRLDIADFFKSL